MCLLRDLPTLRRLCRRVRFRLHPLRYRDCAAKLRRGPRAAGDLKAQDVLINIKKVFKGHLWVRNNYV